MVKILDKYKKKKKKIFYLKLTKTKIVSFPKQSSSQRISNLQRKNIMKICDTFNFKLWEEMEKNIPFDLLKI